MAIPEFLACSHRDFQPQNEVSTVVISTLFGKSRRTVVQCDQAALGPQEGGL